MGDRPLNFRQKSSLKFVEQGDPPFIKQIKTKMGYCEPATISDKFATNAEDEIEDPTKDKDDIRNLTEEERPQIVVLNSETDMSNEELNKEVKKLKEEEDHRKIEEGKIVFRLPEKRIHDNKGENKERKLKLKKTTIERNKLSFNDNEEEEEENN